MKRAVILLLQNFFDRHLMEHVSKFNSFPKLISMSILRSSLPIEASF